MKKVIVLALMALALAPQIASAAWWNPFTWKVFARDSAEIIAIAESIDGPASASSTDAVDTSLLPTSDDLHKRIVELEMKLDRAREDLENAKASAKTPAKSETAVQNTAQAPTNTVLAGKDVLAKVKPAIVLVEGPLGSASGTIIDAQGRILTNFRIMGTSTEVQVTLSNGSKKRAALLGLEESNDLAVVQLSDKKSSAYVSVGYGSGLKVGDAAYVFGFYNGQPVGSAFVEATVAQKTSSSIRATSSEKPLDNGGAIVTSSGSLVGIPNASSCKVLEEGTTCLKHTVNANMFPSRVPLLVQGMKLYKDKKNRTAEEKAFRGHLDLMYVAVNDMGTIQSTIESVTGKNSFDYFNEKLLEDEDGKMPKAYALKLKTAAEKIARTYESLRSASYTLRTALINDSAAVSTLDPYQQKTIEKVRVDNEAWLKAYSSQVDYWTKKKNEYDSYVARPTDTTNDYLITEGAAVEKAAQGLRTEQDKIVNSLSGDVRGIF